MADLYHIWFSTKGRKAVLEDVVRDEALRQLNEAAQRGGIVLQELVVDVDHVHLLVAVQEDQSLAGVMHRLKGASARYLFLKFPEFKLDTISFWQKGYGSRRITPAEAVSVRAYIRTHRERPLRRNA